MRDRRRSLFVATIATGATLALTACGSSTTVSPTPSPASAPATSAPSAVTASRATTASPATTARAKSAVADVDCGPITAANGQKLRVVAKGSAAGVAGCTEAIDVLTVYFQRGSEGQGTAHVLTVQGWRCSTIDNGVTNEVLTGCEKSGLTIAAVNG